MKNWAIFGDGIFHSRYKRRSDADGHAAFLRETTGKRVEVVWDIEKSDGLEFAPDQLSQFHLRLPLQLALLGMDSL
jgi:hypothetical protein